MIAVLAELGLSRLGGGIPALTAVGAAAILAEAGDPRRYDSSSSLVKHAGLSPSKSASGAFNGQARISRRGHPGLWLTVWRAVWPIRLARGVADAPVQSGDGRQVPGHDQAEDTAGDACCARSAPRRGSRAPARCCAGFAAPVFAPNRDDGWPAWYVGTRSTTRCPATTRRCTPSAPR